MTHTVYISPRKHRPTYELSISRSWKECTQYAIDLLSLTIMHDPTHQWNNIDLCFQREHQSLRYTIHRIFNINQPGLCRSGGAIYGTKYYTDTELRGYITTQHSTKNCWSILSTALCICNLCLTMPQNEFRSVSISTYVKTSTNQEELRDELILSEDHSGRSAYS